MAEFAAPPLRRGGRRVRDDRVVRWWLHGLSRLLWRGFLLAALGSVGLGVVAAIVLCLLGRTPREWAPYLQQRARGHRPLITDAADLLAWWLVRADRLAVSEPFRLPQVLGASADRSGTPPSGRIRPVSSQQALRLAVADARPGDIIRIAPGRYRFSGYAIKFDQPGTAAAPIVLRADRLDDVIIETDSLETFHVSAAFWHVENLVMQGVCSDDSQCEHAIHVVGGAASIVIRNNRLIDYNAQIKINGENGTFPDHGAIEGNTLTDTSPRQTDNPVTPIDLVGASGWHIEGNIIADFVRDGRPKPTYGAFAKGAGVGTVIERNVVVCEWKLHGGGGQHVGLSLGGGGTDPGVRRDRGRSGLEQIGGVIRNNLVAACDDDGIYLNQAAGSVVDHNTLIDTAGIEARFAETSAKLTENIVDGTISARDGAALRSEGNAAPFLPGLFVGWHPQRDYFRSPGTFDLRWRRPPDRLPGPEAGDDLCGRHRGADTAPGAFDDFADCLRSAGPAAGG